MLQAAGSVAKLQQAQDGHHTLVALALVMSPWVSCLAGILCLSRRSLLPVSCYMMMLKASQLMGRTNQTSMTGSL
jgi:hypothetical protein